MVDDSRILKDSRVKLDWRTGGCCKYIDQHKGKMTIIRILRSYGEDYEPQIYKIENKRQTSSIHVYHFSFVLCWISWSPVEVNRAMTLVPHVHCWMRVEDNRRC